MSTTIRSIADVSVPGARRTNGHDDRGTQDISAGSRLTADISLRQAALVVGLGLLVLAVLAGIVNFAVLQKLTVPAMRKPQRKISRVPRVCFVSPLVACSP